MYIDSVPALEQRKPARRIIVGDKISDLKEESPHQVMKVWDHTWTVDICRNHNVVYVDRVILGKKSEEVSLSDASASSAQHVESENTKGCLSQDKECDDEPRESAISKLVDDRGIMEHPN